MKYISILLTSFLLLNCNRSDDDNKDYPSCIKSEIQTILQSPAQNPRATIKKFNYKNKLVYLISPNYPDARNKVLDDQCNVVCSEGGISGQTNNPCIDWNTAVYVETAWTDPR